MLREGVHSDPDFLTGQDTTHLPLVHTELELECVDASECQQEIALFDRSAEALTEVGCQDDTGGRRSNGGERNLLVEQAKLLTECLRPDAMESLIGHVALAGREAGLALCSS